jgi:hypothetical protein
MLGNPKTPKKKGLRGELFLVGAVNWGMSIDRPAEQYERRCLSPSKQNIDA